VPAVFTIINGVCSPVFHINRPLGRNTESVEVPLQLSTTFTNGVSGVVFGAAVPLPALLVHPFTVVVTV
jgi:hypothetical protein